MSLRVVPVSWRDTQAFITLWHRTHPKPPRGFKFCVGVANDLDVLVGVASVGRPVARRMQDGMTVEVNRSATDGSDNVNSMLYGAAARAARALGYSRVITYNQEGESGASLRAAGFVLAAQCPPHRGWSRVSRLRGLRGDEHLKRNMWVRICNVDARPWRMPSMPEAVKEVQMDLFDEVSA